MDPKSTTSMKSNTSRNLGCESRLICAVWWLLDEGSHVIPRFNGFVCGTGNFEVYHKWVLENLIEQAKNHHVR